MNERIDQLWAQALDAAVPETYSRLSYSQVLKIKQVFAELIVRECARRSYLEDSGNSEVEEALEFWRKDMLKHFGVEE